MWLRGAIQTACISDAHSPIPTNQSTPPNKQVTNQSQGARPSHRAHRKTVVPSRYPTPLWPGCGRDHHITHQVQQVARQCWLSSRKPWALGPKGWYSNLLHFRSALTNLNQPTTPHHRSSKTPTMADPTPPHRHNGPVLDSQSVMVAFSLRRWIM